MTDLHPFGPHFKTWRERRRLSLKEVAGDIVSPQLLSQFENGKKAVSLVTLSRLLLSMGLDWDDFMADYPGQRLTNYADGLYNRTTNTADAQAYLKDLETYYADAPNTLTIIKALVDYRLYQNLLGSREIHPLQNHIIEKVMEHGHFNLPEIELLAISLHEKKLTLEQLLAYRYHQLNLLSEACRSSDLSKLYNTSGTMCIIVGTLSKQGEYGLAQETIDQTRKNLSKIHEASYHFLFNLITLDIQEVYNWVRWGSKNIPKARERSQEILTFLEAAINYNIDPRISRHCTELITIFKNDLTELINRQLHQG